MALKHRVNIVNDFTLPVGAAALNKGDVVKITSSLAVVATASTAAFIGVTTESADASAPSIRIAGPGSIVLCIAHDSAITEGEWVVPALLGRVDGIATLTTATQYVVGISLMASSAAGQLIPVLLIPFIAVKAAS